MRNFKRITSLLFATVLIAISGCGGGDFAPVSGTVTYDGEPVSKLRVVFSPEPVGEDYAPGPYSIGKTDENGKFTLVTRHEDPGAFVGKHKLSFEYTDIGESAMADLVSSLNDAKDSRDSEKVSKAKDRITELRKKLKGRPLLNNLKVYVDVPEEGLEDYQLDLKEHQNSIRSHDSNTQS